MCKRQKIAKEGEIGDFEKSKGNVSLLQAAAANRMGYWVSFSNNNGIQSSSALKMKSSSAMGKDTTIMLMGASPSVRARNSEGMGRCSSSTVLLDVAGVSL
ncbi:hypothetical protein EYF80_001251 [Liparis tanakae]|uniref:Uncharacterized protein n=1 Tax=Liparis tanakae TaxID=230148 RepID=A0A4Z2JE16_9TELE|nr:hypothetical protein EYF80_001251 [Liparis tanakae]